MHQGNSQVPLPAVTRAPLAPCFRGTQGAYSECLGLRRRDPGRNQEELTCSVAECSLRCKQYAAAFKKGGGNIHVVYRNSAGNPFEFLVITSIPNYAILEGSSFFAIGATPEELARMGDRRAQTIEAVRTTYERPMDDLGFNPPNTPQPSRIMVTRVTVRPEMVEQFATTVKTELVPALKKAGQTSLLVYLPAAWNGVVGETSSRSALR